LQYDASASDRPASQNAASDSYR